ncbi:MAG: 50S ribosomal protein L21 [Chloroflexi bacterium]|nr:50S ribosomal protein L21 [Chloroflexota bacterium]
MKYAIFENGGKQYKAVEGTTVQVDQLAAKVGDKISLDTVLLLVDGEKIEVGTPLVSKASIKATIVDHEKGPKIIIFKYRPKKRYRVKTGHRQKYTRLVIDSIEME